MSRMRTEIGEQATALDVTLDELLPRVAEVGILGRETRQVLFIARGSSDNAAVYGSNVIQTHRSEERRVGKEV